jgi:ABC-type uncharacterized transport system substrate-binding protein
MLLVIGAVIPSRTPRAQRLMPVVGYLSIGSLESDGFRATAFRQGLNEEGYVDNQNVLIEYRWAENQYDRLPDLAVDLVRRPVTALFAVGGTPSALAARAATSTIPIVFNLGIDPVQSGLVASLNRPGGNITGVVVLTTELTAKRFDLLHELLPTAARVALLVNPTSPANDPEMRSAQDAARALGLQAYVLRAVTPSEIETAFATLVELRAEALVVSADPLFTNRRDQLVAFVFGKSRP